MDEKVRQKIEDLQILEQNLKSFLMQGQNINMGLSEISNAVSEINRTSDKVYKMVGSIIVGVDKKETLNELDEKRKLLELRNSSIEKQKKSIESRANELQVEIKKLIEKSPSESKQ